MTAYNIDIVSDTVCPWCYIGKTRLDTAIKQHLATHPSDTFKTTWHPYQLQPDAPRGVEKQAYYAQKFGPQRTQMMFQHLSRVGQQSGIRFAFGGKTGNTRDSHRLLQLARTKGGEAQTRVVEELFRSYFECEEDISSPDVLVRRGVTAGLDEGEVREWLDTGRGGEEVDREVEAARRNYVTGVPSFTINGKYEIQGAEEPEAFLQVFGEIRNDAEADGIKVNGGNVC